MDRYVAANRELWDARTPIHVASDFYDVEGFKAGRSRLREIALEELGDPAGRTLLHLQCHFGLDTLSWARLGARVTGVDFSAEAIRAARELARDAGIEARFVESDVYRLPEALDERFDVVFTSYGVLPWLPDLAPWAEVVASFLRPGGTFHIVEFHPFAWVFDDEPGVSDLRAAYSYFHDREPLRFEEDGTYADPWAPIRKPEYVWAHPLGEVVTCLLEAGLTIELLREHPVTTYQALPFLERGDDGWWRVPAGMPEIPLLFSLRARRPAA